MCHDRDRSSGLLREARKAREPRARVLPGRRTTSLGSQGPLREASPRSRASRSREHRRGHQVGGSGVAARIDDEAGSGVEILAGLLVGSRSMSVLRPRYAPACGPRSRSRRRLRPRSLSRRSPRRRPRARPAKTAKPKKPVPKTAPKKKGTLNKAAKKTTPATKKPATSAKTVTFDVKARRPTSCPTPRPPSTETTRSPSVL